MVNFRFSGLSCWQRWPHTVIIDVIGQFAYMCLALGLPDYGGHGFGHLFYPFGQLCLSNRPTRVSCMAKSSDFGPLSLTEFWIRLNIL